MLTLSTRIWIAMGVLTLTVVGAIVLEVTHAGGDMGSVLLGWAGATMVQLLDMLQAKRKASVPPLPPAEPLTREDTHPRLPLALPREGLPVAPEDFELDEDNRPTLRPQGRRDA